MKKRVIALTLLTAIALSACGEHEPYIEVPEKKQAAEPAENTQVEIPYSGSDNSQELTKDIATLTAPPSQAGEEQISALSGAGTRLFAQTVAGEGEDSNVLISPISVAMAFGMAEGGANGTTLSQMEDVIGGGNTTDEMSALLYGLSKGMKNSSEADWNVANSIWFKDDGTWEIGQEFARKAASWYDAQLWKAPFDDTTVADINAWVNSQTRGMIPGIIDSISDEARMYIINALAFEAEWMQEYEEDRIFEDMDFTNADGSKSKVTMLYSDESGYFELCGGTGFLKKYKGGEYSFMGLLPAEGTDLDDYIKTLGDNGADISSAIRNINYGDVVAEIPEFTIDYSAEMSELLKSMGMTDAFERSQADLSGIMHPLNGDGCEVWIEGVVHKTHIEVDRKGTRAAAVTELAVAGCDCVEEYIPPVYVILDRPFIYGIIDNATGLPIFLGCMNQM